MEAKKISSSNNVLKSLVPLGALSAPHLEALLKKTDFENIPGGEFVFKHGERDRKNVYLIEGNVELLDRSQALVGTLVAGTEMARHPIAQRQPRLLSVRAAGPVVVARVDSGLLDVLLTWDQTSGYAVDELGGDGDEDWLTRLLQSDTFRHLSPAQIQQLITRIEPLVCVAGDEIIREGEAADHFYIVKRGRVSVTRRSAVGEGYTQLAELSEGACFGEEGLVSGEPRNATVTALADGVLMRLEKRDFDELLGAPLLKTLDYPAALAHVQAGAVWVDVRLHGEFSNLRLPDSVNVPVAEIRTGLGEFARDKTYVLCCDTGRRSAAAAFVLRQQGLDVAVLEHGLGAVPSEALIGGELSLDGASPAAANGGAADDTQTELIELKTANAMLLTDIAALERKLEAQTQALETLRQEYDSDLDTARRAMGRAQEETQNVQRAQSRLHAAVKAAEQRLEEEQRRHEQEIFGLKRELRRVNPSGPDAAGVQARENEELAARDARIAELDAALAGVRHALDATVAQHAQALAERDAQFRALEQASGDQRQAMAREIEALGQESERREAELSSMRRRAEALDIQIRERESALYEAQAELVSLEARSAERIQAFERASEQWKGERDELQQALDAARAEVGRLRNELESAENVRAVALEAEVRRLEALRDDPRITLDSRAETDGPAGHPGAAVGDPESPDGATRDIDDAAVLARMDDDREEPLAAMEAGAGATEPRADEFDAEIERFQAVLDDESAGEELLIEALPIREIGGDADFEETEVSGDSTGAEALDVFPEADPDEQAPTQLLDWDVSENPARVPRSLRIGWYALVFAVAGAGVAAYLQGAFDRLGVFDPTRTEDGAVEDGGRGVILPDAGGLHSAPENEPSKLPVEASSGHTTALSSDVAAAAPSTIAQSMMRGSSAAPPGSKEPPVSPDARESGATQVEVAAPPAPKPYATTPVKVRRSFNDSLTDGSFGPTMVELSGGDFLMGSPAASANFNERPQRQVSLPVFSVSQFEVTFAEYDRFAGATGRRLPADRGWGRDTRPVINVSWDDAQAYVHWLSEQTGRDYRLPTEAEWEYAARAGSVTHYWWGNDLDKVDARANCFDCGSAWDATRTAPVGQFPANAVGLHDTAGNVMEWVEDCYVGSYGNAPLDGSAVTAEPPCRSRVVRGGGYDSAPTALRSAARADRPGDTRLDDLGFRVVRRR